MSLAKGVATLGVTALERVAPMEQLRSSPASIAVTLTTSYNRVRGALLRAMTKTLSLAGQVWYETGAQTT